MPTYVDNTLTDLNLKTNEICYLFTDGACLKPGGRGAAAWVAVHEFDITYASTSFEVSTNNQMELSAAFDALYWALENGHKKIILISDSQYAINCIAAWSKKWIVNNWMIKGEPVKNQDLIKPIIELGKQFEYFDLHWTRGHAGCYYNERADWMAENLRDFKPTTIQNHDGPLTVPTCYKYTFEPADFEPVYYEEKLKQAKAKKKASKRSVAPYRRNQFTLFSI